MRSSIAILSFLATAALADDVVSFFWPGGYEGADPVATITTVNPTATGMRIACPTDVDSTECGWGDGLDVSIIDGTKYQATMKGETFDMSIDCDYNSKASKMTCVADLNDTPTTGVLSGTDLIFVTASVAEGAELLASATPTADASGSANASQAPKSTAAVAVSTGLKSSASASASASATSSGSLPDSTGAAARFGIEGSALLVLAGAAALSVW
jgi:hypothetical protein